MGQGSLEGILAHWRGQDKAGRLDSGMGVLMDMVNVLTEGEQPSLTTDFGRIAYFIQKFGLAADIRGAIYTLRDQFSQYKSLREDYADPEELLSFSDTVLEWISGVDGGVQRTNITLEVPAVFRRSKVESRDRLGVQRILLTGKTEEALSFLGVSEETGAELLIRLPQSPGPSHDEISQHFGSTVSFPFYINAFDVELGEDGELTCGYYVILPDYLVDVTAIASGYQGSDFSVRSSLLHRMLPRETTYYMLLGNVVNHFLDKMIVDPGLSSVELIKEVFRLFPIEISQMQDDEVSKLVSALKMHYANLQMTLKEDFPKLDIKPEQCELEPTFLSSKYGLQGRLDVLAKGEETTIIELKSGKPFRPNSYGLKADHYVQTLLYDLLIRSAKISRSPRNFILYSGQTDKRLRYAPPVKAVQVEALQARNQLVVMEWALQSEDPKSVHEMMRTQLTNLPSEVSSFTVRDVDKILRLLNNSASVERMYFYQFFSFVMRELALSKIGCHEGNRGSGLASIWLHDKNRKNEDFEILAGLRFAALKEDNGSIYVTMTYGSDTNPLANFRNGDVIVLYPSIGTKKILEHEIYKCSLIERGAQEVIIRLRSKQVDDSVFKQVDTWNIEKDVLDSSFNALFDSLTLFLGSSHSNRQKLLGQSWPDQPDSKVSENFHFSDHLLPDQKDVLSQVISSKDYFLLWGPPGTGKTSVMIRELIRYYHDESDWDIYLLAYTNRAVDELCSVVHDLSAEYSQSAIRLGSRHSTDPIYSEYLFDHQIGHIENRKDFNDLIWNKRIVISTLASFWGKRQLVKEGRKALLIVDEASQILEPAIIGLLHKFEKFILVGDHLQLPAVSTQSESQAQIKMEELSRLGFRSMKESFFQRLLRQLKNEKITGHTAILKHQGRMHRQIMNFVNAEFYDGLLDVVPGVDRLITTEPPPDDVSGLERMIYINSHANSFASMIKNNEDEAKKVVSLIRLWLEKGQKSLGDIDQLSCGVITPFRAQIALIKHELRAAFGAASNNITVDTVERYQGGARDFIIISLCLNRPSQLTTVVSLSEDGVDRKFNVAITRARERVAVIGNADIMSRVGSYRAYIEKAKRLEL